MQPARFALTVALATLGGAATAQRFSDATLGLELKLPPKWRQVPWVPDGRGVEARFESERVYVAKDRTGMIEHRPTMTVICLAAGPAPDGVPTTKKRRPYSGYGDWLTLRHSKAHRVVEQKSLEIGGVPCERIVVDLSSRFMNRKLVTGLFRAEGVSIAVEFDVLADRLDKLQSAIDKSLRTVRFKTDRDVAAASRLRAGVRYPLWITDRDAWSALSLSERHARRKRLHDEFQASVRAASSKSIALTESAGFQVLSGVDKRYTARIAKATHEFWMWCEREFDTISDDIVRGYAITIGEADGTEFLVMSDTGNSFSRGYEPTVHRVLQFSKDTYYGNTGLGMGSLFADVLSLYLQDKDYYAWRYMPRWLSGGLFGYVGDAVVKGNKLTFPIDEYGREYVRELERAGQLFSLQQIMAWDDDEYTTELEEGSRRAGTQVTLAVRYLFGPGRKNDVLKTFFADYIKAVVEVTERHRKTWDEAKEIAKILEDEKAARQRLIDAGKIDPEAKPKDADEIDEEDERERLLQKLWRKRRSAISKDLPGAAPKISPADWEKIERDYARFSAKS